MKVGKLGFEAFVTNRCGIIVIWYSYIHMEVWNCTVLASGMWIECTGPKMAYVCAFRVLLASLKSHRAAIWEAPPLQSRLLRGGLTPLTGAPS